MSKHSDHPTAIKNRSMPPGSVIPELAYEDVREAATWLCETFGFKERLLIGNHRIQLLVGDGSVVVTERRQEGPGISQPGDIIHSTMVSVEDVDGHHQRVARSGARILRPPTTHPFGERQYTVEDLGGHQWTFSQSVADVDPKDWGGVLVNPA
jgi:uncharacterized glyoxalase superfamily protein PhnB